MLRSLMGTWVGEENCNENAPNLIPKFRQLLLIFRINGELGLWVNNDAGIELSPSEHHRIFNVGIPIEDALWRLRKHQNAWYCRDSLPNGTGFV